MTQPKRLPPGIADKVSRLSRLDLRHRLVELVGKYEVPGASVSVLADGEVIDAAAGFVNVRTGVKVQPDSPFMIQSITKVWTATLVMQLADEGLVVLDEPVNRYLPGFRTADERASAEVTVRHLLTHTGGFEGDIWAETTGGTDALQLFVDEHVARAHQHVAPGHLYSYCSAGMGVLGRMVEVLRDMTYADALRRYLIGPLGVEGVAADAGEALAYRTAIGHVQSGPGESLRPLRTWAVMPPSNPAAGNQLAMPARGLTTLAAMHLADGLTIGGSRLLSAESASLMREPLVDVPATMGPSARQGLGWRVTPAIGMVEHSGDTIGCGAMLRLVPDRGVAVALLANGGDVAGLISELCDELLDELAGIVPNPPSLATEAAAVGDATRYVGRYELRNQVAEVTEDHAGRLWLTVSGRNEAVRIATRVGIELEPDTCELRRIDRDTFLRLDYSGQTVGVVELIDTDAAGRARYLHDGRAAPRVD